MRTRLEQGNLRRHSFAVSKLRRPGCQQTTLQNGRKEVLSLKTENPGLPDRSRSEDAHSALLHATLSGVINESTAFDGRSWLTATSSQSIMPEEHFAIADIGSFLLRSARRWASYRPIPPPHLPRSSDGRARVGTGMWKTLCVPDRADCALAPARTRPAWCAKTLGADRAGAWRF